jgi:hypothetical protein
MTTTPDRLKEAFADIIQAMLPRLLYLATWEYSVLAATPGPPTKIDCRAVDPGTEAALPQTLTQLTLWPGPSGFVAVPTPGSIVRVSFVNGDPSKPAIVGLDPASTPLLVMGFVNTVVQLGDASAVPLTKAPWSTALEVALAAFAAALAAAPPTPPQVQAAAVALQTALGLLVPLGPATLKTLGS